MASAQCSSKESLRAKVKASLVNVSNLKLRAWLSHLLGAPGSATPPVHPPRKRTRRKEASPPKRTKARRKPPAAPKRKAKR